MPPSSARPFSGDTVILEFGAAYQRHTSAIYHTVAIGKSSSEVECLLFSG